MAKHKLTQFKLLQHSSGNFLACEYPDNWQDMTEEEQNDFIEYYCWEPMENKTADDIANIISCAANALSEFLANNGVIVK